MAARSDNERLKHDLEKEICNRLIDQGVLPETLAPELAQLDDRIRSVAARVTLLEIARMGEIREPVERPNIENFRKVIAEKEPGSFVLLTQDEATHLCDYIEFLESRPGQK